VVGWLILMSRWERGYAKGEDLLSTKWPYRIPFPSGLTTYYVSLLVLAHKVKQQLTTQPPHTIPSGFTIAASPVSARVQNVPTWFLVDFLVGFLVLKGSLSTHTTSLACSFFCSTRLEANNVAGLDTSVRNVACRILT